MPEILNQIIQGDALTVLKTLPDEIFDCCITSPPYWRLRNYGIEGQLGLEKTPEEYVEKLVAVFREVKRCLKKTGTCWLNLGDNYAGSGKGPDGKRSKEANKVSCAAPPFKSNILKPKNLCGIPWRVAFALQKDGWYLRQDIIWSKPNPMPERVTDRCTKSHEYIFLLTKSAKYYFDNEAIKEKANYDGRKDTIMKAYFNGSPNPIGNRHRERWPNKDKNNIPMRNKRSVWTVTTVGDGNGIHFATFPEDLVTPMVLAGCPKGGLILDPFAGSGTTGYVAAKLQRNYCLIELNPKYINEIAILRINEAETGVTIREQKNGQKSLFKMLNCSSVINSLAAIAENRRAKDKETENETVFN